MIGYLQKLAWRIVGCLLALSLIACSRVVLPLSPSASNGARDGARLPENASPEGLNLREPSERLSGSNSWMARDAQEQNLLYVSDNQTVNVFSYPQGTLEGVLRGLHQATGTCVDKRGNVFIVSLSTGEVIEYAHGDTKREATLKIPTGDPIGCAVDASTGDLAVAGHGSGSSGAVFVFKDARGRPTAYQDSRVYQFYFCGYDSKGNLFADGLTAPGSRNFALAELRHGKTAFTSIAANQYVQFPGGVQWDGKHLAVGDQFTHIYEFAISGSHGTLAGTTGLGSDAEYVKQFWIQRGNDYRTQRIYPEASAEGVQRSLLCLSSRR